MLSSKVASAFSRAVRKAFADIGIKGQTAMPETRSNTDHLAWEYYLAHELVSIAEARKKVAAAECITAGVMFDHKENPLPAGTVRTIYSGDIININVTVNNASPRFDPKLLKGVLLRLDKKHKITSETANEIYEACLVEGTPAHIFKASPIVESES